MVTPDFALTACPRGVTDRPRGVTDRPRGVTDRPRGVTNRPRGVTDRPRGVTNRPRGETDRPRGEAVCAVIRALRGRDLGIPTFLPPTTPVFPDEAVSGSNRRNFRVSRHFPRIEEFAFNNSTGFTEAVFDRLFQNV